MLDELRAHDLEALFKVSFEAFGRGDFDAVYAIYAPDAAFDVWLHCTP
jgi:ketosteroid isomerase-like protein